MRRVLVLMVALSTPASAAGVGTISTNGDEMNVVDTYTTFSEESGEVTIHLLPCKYSNELKTDWKPEFGFLKCYPIAKAEYYSAPGALITIKVEDQGQAGRVVFSTTAMGDMNGYDYRGFSQSWFRNPPLDGFVLRGRESIEFSMDFVIPEKSMKVSLSISTSIDEIIESK